MVKEEQQHACGCIPHAPSQRSSSAIFADGQSWPSTISAKRLEDVYQTGVPGLLCMTQPIETPVLRCRTCNLVLLVQLNEDLLVAILEAEALHVGAVVVPHHSQLQLGGHLLKQLSVSMSAFVSIQLRTASGGG